MTTVLPVPNLTAIGPEILVTVLACALLIVDLFVPKDKKRAVGVLALAGTVVAGLFTMRYWGYSATTFSGMFVVDNFAVIFKEVFLFATALTMLISLKYLEIEKVSLGEYYALMLFCTLGMMVMVSAADLVVIYIGLETMALSVYVLSGFMRFNAKSSEAALKYFLVGVFISGILLYGIALTYGVVGSTNLHQIAETIKLKGLKDNPVLMVAMFLLAAGFGLEIAMAPFHFWAPDVYEGSPTPVTAFISVAPKAAAFAALIRVFVVGIGLLAPHWQVLLWVIAALTMTIGNVTAALQKNVKRMLAYSSIAHAGYMLLGVLAVNTTGLAGVAFYFFAYAFMNMGAFGVIILLRRDGIVGDEVDDFKGLAYTNPMAALLMVVFLLSLTGIPPTAGFIGKFMLFSAAIKAGFYWLVVIAVLNSVVSLFYYFRIAQAMYMGEAPDGSLPKPHGAPSLTVAIAIVGVLTLFFGIYPHHLIELARASVTTFIPFL